MYLWGSEVVRGRPLVVSDQPASLISELQDKEQSCLLSNRTAARESLDVNLRPPHSREHTHMHPQKSTNSYASMYTQEGGTETET